MASKRWEPLPEGLHIISDAFGDEYMEASIGGSLLTIPNETSSIQLDPDEYRLCHQVDSPPMVELTPERIEALERLLFEVRLSVDAGWTGERANAPMGIVRAMLDEAKGDGDG